MFPNSRPNAPAVLTYQDPFRAVPAIINFAGNLCTAAESPPCKLPDDVGLRASTKFFISISNRGAPGSGPQQGTIWIDDVRID